MWNWIKNLFRKPNKFDPNDWTVETYEPIEQYKSSEEEREFREKFFKDKPLLQDIIITGMIAIDKKDNPNKTSGSLLHKKP